MNPTPNYSQFLHCVYDEAGPRGRIGTGTHYSIFRNATWKSTTGTDLKSASVHDFAVVWDEDHDERIIWFAERLLMEGLLFPVLFIGERRGSLTALLSPDFATDEAAVKRYEARLNKIAGHVPTLLPSGNTVDSWNVDLCMLGDVGASGGHRTGLVNDEVTKSNIYLHNILNLWKLGHKAFSASNFAVRAQTEPLAQR